MLLYMLTTLQAGLMAVDLSLQQSITKAAKVISSANAGKQQAASTTGNHLTRKEKVVSQIQTDVATNMIATSKHDSYGSPLEARQVNLHAGIAPSPLPSPFNRFLSPFASFCPIAINTTS